MKYSNSWVWSSVGQFICTNFLPASGGSLPHVARLIDEFLIDFFDQRVLQEACERGAPMQELEFILERSAPDWREVVKSAIRGGHLHVFHWMTERQDLRGPWEVDLSRSVIVAAEYGRLDLLKLLVAKGADCDGYKEVQIAAANGHLEVVKWLYEHKGRRNGCANALIEAAENGHLDVVKWFHKNNEKQFDGWETTCMMSAAGHGHLEVLKWLHQRHFGTYRSVVMDNAARAGHLHVTQWLMEIGSEGCSPNGIYLAAENGGLAMVRWLSKHFSGNFTSQAMDSAAGNNQLEVVKWLHENRLEDCTSQAMDNAALNGDLETIKWLHANRTEAAQLKQ